MNPETSQYFSLKQLALSLAIAVAIGGGALLTVWSYQSLTGDNTELPEPLATTTTAVPQAALTINAYEKVSLSARSAIVLDLTNGQTLYSQNADTELPLASLTKLLSTYAAQRALSANTPIVVSSTSIAQEGDSGIVVGESFTAENLAKLSLVGSSNDAADALTTAAARTSSQQSLLASAAASAGLGRTRAVNGTGLDVDLSQSGAYGTARDIAKLAGMFAREYPSLSKATTRNSVRVVSREGVVHELPNTNRFASGMPGLMLSKTGFTDLAGGNLVIVYDAGINRPVAIAVLGSTREARFSDVQALMSATQRQLDMPTASTLTAAP